jgi:colanic acid/amylovoran biosynthesis glycosyltransferase
VRIGYLVSHYPLPSHTFVRREIAALRKRGVEVETFSIRPAHSLSEADRAEEARTFYVLQRPWVPTAASLVVTFARHPGRWLSTLAATLRNRLPGVRPLLLSIAYFAEAMRLALELERRGVTHVHNTFANPASHVGMAATRYLGIGWSVALHGLGDFDGPSTPLLAGKVAASRFVVCATDYGRAQTMRLSDPDHWSKLHVVRCGVEADALPAPPARWPGSGERIQILSVGRLSPEKGQLGLLEGFADAVRRGLDAGLVLIGGGPEEARIRAAVEAHGIADRVQLRGAQPETAVLEAMARAHVFVLSSFMEGLPVVLMEAMALGLPVIAPAITGIPELVVHRETGLLYTVGRWDELADRMRLLATDPELRARVVSEGRARLRPEFDVAHSAARLDVLFRDSGGA